MKLYKFKLEVIVSKGVDCDYVTILEEVPSYLIVDVRNRTIKKIQKKLREKDSCYCVKGIQWLECVGIRRISPYHYFVELLSENRSKREIKAILNISSSVYRDFLNYYQGKTPNLTVRKLKEENKYLSLDDIKTKYKIPNCEFHYFLDSIKA